jgi:hypothetical protein
VTREGERERRETPPAPAAVEAPRVTASASTPRCPYCHAELSPELLAARCVACETAHHPTCFDEHGSCSVHGCGGKVARVAILGGRTERAVLGPCLACQATVHLDENVVVCATCESFHHPRCLEARGGCARCGAREATLLPAGAHQRARRLRGRRSPWGPASIAAAVVLSLAAYLVHERFQDAVMVSILASLALVETVVGIYVLSRRPPP